jgi:hypothetical protein
MDRTNILKFLNRYYKIEDNSFFDTSLNKKVYGSDILEHLNVVFSIDENTNKELIKEWALKTITLETFEENWQFNRAIPEVGRYELKRMNRFLITFPEHFNIPQWVTFEASRPSARLITKDILGVKLFKKLVWDDMIIKMNDPIGPSTSQSIMDLIHKSLYEKKQLIKDKFNLKLEMLDPVGHVVEKWALSNCEFKSIDFGELSCQIDDPVVCSLVIKLGDVVLEY